MTATLERLVRVGHSPDADDAFMFYALAKNKIPMRGFRVEHVVEDIESLNLRALRAELEVTAVSCHAYAYVSDRYWVMRSGSSVGDNYGPILVAPAPSLRARKMSLRAPKGRSNLSLSGPKQSPAGGSLIRGKKIAVPGKLTTAFLALRLYEPDFEPVFVPFDRIFEAVSSGAAELGLVIHEGQITFAQKGFRKVADLGVWWHERTGCPLPLGVDVIRKDLGGDAKAFAALFRESIEYALAHRSEALEYALEYGRGIGKDLGDRFVGMYVNRETVELSPAAEKGFRLLLREAFEKKLIPQEPSLEFV